MPEFKPHCTKLGRLLGKIFYDTTVSGRKPEPFAGNLDHLAGYMHALGALLPAFEGMFSTPIHVFWVPDPEEGCLAGRLEVFCRPCYDAVTSIGRAAEFPWVEIDGVRHSALTCGCQPEVACPPDLGACDCEV